MWYDLGLERLERINARIVARAHLLKRLQMKHGSRIVV